jgi:hypothetical protein
MRILQTSEDVAIATKYQNSMEHSRALQAKNSSITLGISLIILRHAVQYRIQKGPILVKFLAIR